jgi:Ca2+/Na+ antiporter
MTPVSHALLPVFFGQKLISVRDGIPAFREVSIVAFCGALPDILSPHLSLESRYTALSHSVYALGIFIALIGIASIFSPLLRRLSILCILAYAGHIACDMISGGVALFYPQRIHVYGDAYIPHWLWITSDGLLLLYIYLVYRWLPLRRRLKLKSPHTMIAATEK